MQAVAALLNRAFDEFERLEKAVHADFREPKSHNEGGFLITDTLRLIEDELASSNGPSKFDELLAEAITEIRGCGKLLAFRPLLDELHDARGALLGASLDASYKAARWADPSVRDRASNAMMALRRWLPTLASETSENHSNEKPGFLRLIVDKDSRTAGRPGAQAVEFGSKRKPWEVFFMLFQAKGSHRTLRQIEDAIWPDDPHAPNAVSQAVARANKLLAPLGVEIKGERGPQYHLIENLACQRKVNGASTARQRRVVNSRNVKRTSNHNSGRRRNRKAN